MKKMHFIVLILLCVQLLGTYKSWSQQIDLKSGDIAPSLHIQKWIKGEPVEQFKKGSVYLIEFSAVGCAPCRLEVQHLSKLSETYKGRLEIISIYTLESNPKNPQDLKYIQRIEKYINSISEKVKYTVAIDVPEQSTFNVWATAAGLNGIPAAFFVDENSRIRWIGHPGSADDIVSAALDGKRNLQEVVKQKEEISRSNQRVIDDIEKLRTEGYIEIAVAKIDSMIAKYPERKGYDGIKFRLLIGSNDLLAYQLLQAMLNKYGDNYDWFHLISQSYSNAIEPNYFLAHEVADRAISQETSNTLIAFARVEKSLIYRRQGALQEAVNQCSLALEAARNDAAIDSRDLAYFQDNLEFAKNLLRKSKS